MLIPTSIVALTQWLVALTPAHPQSSLIAPASSAPSSTLSASTLALTSTSVLGYGSERVQPVLPKWIGELPPVLGDDGENNHDRIQMGASTTSSCTFSVALSPLPASVLCRSFEAYCTAFKDELRSRKIRSLKSTPPLRSPPTSASARNNNSNDGDGDGVEDDNPLKDVKFRTGCVGGTGPASDGSYLSGFTATCIVDGVDWIPYVFDSFLRAEFAQPGNDDGPLPVYSSFIGCQIPTRA